MKSSSQAGFQVDRPVFRTDPADKDMTERRFVFLHDKKAGQVRSEIAVRKKFRDSIFILTIGSPCIKKLYPAYHSEVFDKCPYVLLLSC